MSNQNVSVFKLPGHPVKIEQTPLKREWMDDTDNRHAYKCFPISLANTLGWSVSFDEDIEFIWDGVLDTTPDHVQIIRSPHNVCSTTRGNATISFFTGLTFKTDEDVSVIAIPPPNYFVDGAIPFTSVLSTSFFSQEYPLAWRITRPNFPILIPAGMPVATLLPVSLTSLSQIELNIFDQVYDQVTEHQSLESLAEWDRLSKLGKFTNFYREAVNYKGESVGKHEVKNLSLKINDFSKKGKG